MNKKTKDDEIILFNKTIKRMFKEILKRHTNEINLALTDVYEELNLLNRLKSEKEQFILLPGFIGLKIIKEDKINEKNIDEVKKTNKGT